MTDDGVVDATIYADDGLTVRDERGASLVVERWDDGSIAAWIAPPGDNDGPSVQLSADDRRRVAAYLLDGLP
ncbi:hypothetical protein O7626_39760 [Micromonospora sp. WMMD1102]|uniref:hypothetical protein n=1 Tax=Micromonospora sp. WMMD1102 TaxID=3016105 RepID=UPI00241585B9|nr:hypothetical protein [Micromonospora sp. WMMD1102]MDG4791952.1 hypothetical protein [Micromonospora sp. WMMD1102]